MAQDIRGRHALLIAFGGIQGLLAIPPFEFFGLTRGLDVDKLYVRDHGQAWYQAGLPGLASNIGAIADYLRDTIAEADARRVVMVGNSMGGSTSMGVAIERPELVDRVVLMGSAGIQAPPSEELKSIMNYDFTPEGMRKIVKGLTNPAFEANEELVNYRHALSIEDDTRAAYSAARRRVG